MNKSPFRYFLLTLVLILIDQSIKMWVHFNMFLGEEIPLLGDWFKIHYVTNEGMAFGMRLEFIPGNYGKLVLSVFRLFAMGGIAWYLVRLARRGAHQGLLWSVAAILGGAIGNVIDSTFYGVLFFNAPYGSPTPWFHGQVVDMFYIDPWQGTLPEWLPIWGGEYYSNPIFNFADASIFVGVVVILFSQEKFFEQPKASRTQTDEGAIADDHPAPAEASEENPLSAEIPSDDTAERPAEPTNFDAEAPSSDFTKQD
jgi:signal peptidase II